MSEPPPGLPALGTCSLCLGFQHCTGCPCAKRALVEERMFHRDGVRYLKRKAPEACQWKKADMKHLLNFLTLPDVPRHGQKVLADRSFVEFC